MTSRTGRDSDRDRASRSPDPDAEAAAITNAITGLRRRLRRPGAVENPEVRSSLEELLAEVPVFDDQDRKPGRHRSPGAQPPGCEQDSPQAQESRPATKPDPAAIQTPAELVSALRDFKACSPKASWRKIAARGGQLAVHSTIYQALQRSTSRPSLEVVQTLISGCGGSAAEVADYTAAWHRVKEPAHEEPADRDLLAAPVLALELASS